MNPFKRETRESTIQRDINSVVTRITEDYSDDEIAQFVTGIKIKSLEYLKERQERLNDSFLSNINAIKNIEL